MDMEAVKPHIHCCGSIVIPKVGTASDVQKINALLEGSACQAFICIESPKGLVELGSIMREANSLAGLIVLPLACAPPPC